MKCLLPLTTLALLLSSSAQAGNRELCDYPHECSSNKYLAIWNPDDPQADCDTTPRSCEPRWLPPPDVYLDCYYVGYSYVCEAWPQGPEISYSWSSTGFLGTPFPSNGSQAYVDCTSPVTPPRGGTVTVTVIGPLGYSTTGMVALTCRDNEIQ